MTTNNESSDKSHEERLRALVESTNPKLLVSVLKGELLAAWMARSAALPVTDAMVDRFLAWRLPKDFAPDGGISFKPINHPSNPWPVGTNVFTADQARQMLEYVLEGSSPPTDAERDSNAIMLRALLNILAPRQREGETAPAALVRLLAPPIPSPERSGAPRAWMNAEGLISSACGGGYDTPLYDRKALSEALAPAVKTQAEADAVSELIDTVAPSSEVTGTPRTDAEEFDAGDRMAYATMSPGLCVPADFARQLERELAHVTDVCDIEIKRRMELESRTPSAIAPTKTRDTRGHAIRSSDSSLYDEICANCGATDAAGDDRLEHQCPAGGKP